MPSTTYDRIITLHKTYVASYFKEGKQINNGSIQAFKQLCSSDKSLSLKPGTLAWVKSQTMCTTTSRSN